MILNKEREVEMAQEMAELDIKNVLKQMKHLQYEQQTRIGELRAEFMTQLKAAQEDHGAQEQHLLRDKRELRKLLREKEESVQSQLQELKLRHGAALTEERKKFEQELAELQEHHEIKFHRYVDESGLRQRLEIEEIEERKNNQIAKLIEAHDHSYNELKNYYADITTNNLALIGSLKEQMEEFKERAEKNEKIVSEVTAENRRLVVPLQEAKSEVAELRKRMENVERDRAALKRYQKRCETVEKLMNNQKWELEEVKLLLDNTTEERDSLKLRFEEAILELQQKTGLKNVLLERKIALLEQETEKREAVLGEVLTVAGLEPQALSIRVEKLLQLKNEKIQELKMELMKANNKIADLQTKTRD